MPSAKPASSSTTSAPSSTVPPDLAAMFSGITTQQLSTLSTQLGMTADEHSRVSTAMRDPAFLQLLADYAREMSDPEVKRQQDELLRKMEHEAGVSSRGKGSLAENGTIRGDRKQPTRTSELDLD